MIFILFGGLGHSSALRCFAPQPKFLAMLGTSVEFNSPKLFEFEDRNGERNGETTYKTA